MPKLLFLPCYKDDRGSLTVIEKVLPFEIKRVYYIYDTNHYPRAGHKHLIGQQALVCLQGKCTVEVQTNGLVHNLTLDSPEQCLILEAEEWHKINFLPSSILLVLASHLYNGDNYVNDRV